MILDRIPGVQNGPGAELFMDPPKAGKTTRRNRKPMWTRVGGAQLRLNLKRMGCFFTIIAQDVCNDSRLEVRQRHRHATVAGWLEIDEAVIRYLILLGRRLNGLGRDILGSPDKLAEQFLALDVTLFRVLKIELLTHQPRTDVFVVIRRQCPPCFSLPSCRKFLCNANRAFSPGRIALRQSAVVFADDKHIPVLKVFGEMDDATAVRWATDHGQTER